MSKYKVTAAKTTTGMQVSAGTRGFEITFDEPESTNTGMNPVEILLASFGACQAITAQALAKKRNFDLRAFWVTIEGDLGREDVADGKNVRKFTEIQKQPPANIAVSKLIYISPPLDLSMFIEVMFFD